MPVVRDGATLMGSPVGFWGSALGGVAVGLGSLLAAGLLIQGLEGLQCSTCGERKISRSSGVDHYRQRHPGDYRDHVQKYSRRSKKRRRTNDFKWDMPFPDLGI